MKRKAETENESEAEEEVVRGIIFRRTIRASYASLDIVLDKLDSEEDHVVVLLQFHDVNSVVRTKNTQTLAQQHHDVGPIAKDEHEKELPDEGEAAEVHIREIRSYIRRTCKLGTLMEFYQSKWIASNGEHQQNSQTGVTKRLELVMKGQDDDDTVESILDKKLKIIQIHKWTMMQCQTARAKYYPDNVGKDANQIKKSKNKNNKNDKAETNGRTGHGGGVGKRQQGEIVTDFLIQLIHNSSLVPIDNEDGETSSKENSKKEVMSAQDRNKVIDFLNNGSGVLDVAGGSGHLSLALSLRGIKSTVIDPRENVGKLPGRDRKTLKKALNRYKQQQQHSKQEKDTSVRKEENNEKRVVYPSPPPMQFSSYRAWFAKRPEGIDVDFREGSATPITGDTNESNLKSKEQEKNNVVESEQEGYEQTVVVPICSMCSPDKLLPTCSAIIALHPDEATGDIVDFAVTHRIPFLCVPCCVFSRLFPNRLKPLSSKNLIGGGVSESSNGSSRSSRRREVVSTYDDLIEYLMYKDESINMTKLDFDGANLALWSTFPDG